VGGETGAARSTRRKVGFTNQKTLLFQDKLIRQTGFIKMGENAFQSVQVGNLKIDFPGRPFSLNS
jgi:hypothetical protein